MKNIYSIKRKVITGKKIARSFGFPTANLKYYKRDEKIESGVYVVNIKINQNRFNGLAFIGKPKVFKKDNKVIEVFVFQYKGNLYNKIIVVDFLKKIRGIKKFRNVKALQVEIKKDIVKAKKFLNI